MKIAIFGSWYKKFFTGNDEWEMDVPKEEFWDVCLNIGKKLADYGHSIIVASDADYTADYGVVQGFLEFYKAKELHQSSIYVHTPKFQSYPYQDIAKEYPGLFSYHPKTQEDWRASHLNSIKEADAVIVIGGERFSYYAGLSSIIANKKIVPIACFGGAAEKLLDIIVGHPEIKNKEDYLKLNGPWTERSLEITLKILGIKDYPKIFIIHGWTNDWKVLSNYLSKELGLIEPVIMGQEFGESRTLPEKFEDLASEVDAAIALATPDDIGGLCIDDNQNTIPQNNINYNPRARQNVWLEIGWLWGGLGRKKMLILYKGDIELPSDIGGMDILKYEENPLERKKEIDTFIKKLKE